ncbi:ArsR family transcriptional regulator [Microbacterium oxydans]|nr:ArsR family transcriptional regulator [Microbacterium oxydans]
MHILCCNIKNMHSSSLPIFRSDSQLAVLEAVFSAEGAISTSEIVRRARISQPLANRELRRLADAGIFTASRIGRSALFVADEKNPATPHLRALVSIATGPQRLLAQVLRGVPGIDRALIFGSFAARSHGLPGANPNDIDLLVVGDPVRAAVYEAIESVEQEVAREIHVTFLSRARWERGDEELVYRVRSSPVLDLLP